MSEQKWISADELSERWGEPLLKIIALTRKGYLHPIREDDTRILSERYILSSDFAGLEQFRDKVRQLYEYYRDLGSIHSEHYLRILYQIPENFVPSQVLAIPNPPTQNEYKMLGGFRIMRPNYNDTSGELIEIFKNCYFYLEDIEEHEKNHKINPLKSVEEYQSITPESEAEEVRLLTKKHGINKGQAKDIRAAILNDDEKFDYLTISRCLGFNHDTKAAASENLRSRASKGRKLRKKYNE
jgi:hypothetical protein